MDGRIETTEIIFYFLLSPNERERVTERGEGEGREGEGEGVTERGMGGGRERERE